jgi:hypothetical protein
MENTDKMHLCWNCDAQISMEHSSCPYCGAQLNYEERVGQSEGVPLQGEETEQQAYYVQNPEGGASDEWGNAIDQTMVEQQDIARKEGVEGMLLPLLFLLAGGVFFFFGALLLLFAQDGELILRWSQGYWMLYWAVGIPSLFFGWKLLKRLAL